MNITKDNILTFLIIGICSIIFVSLNVNDPEKLSDILAPREFEIWNGKYWALITSAFVHIEIFHIFFNMWWCKDFGLVLERNIKKSHYLIFIIFSAAASSSMQLVFSDQTGIGYSGVVYALFGLLLAGKNTNPEFRAIVNPSTTKWLLGWMIFCVIMTETMDWNIANSAHVAGFTFGYATGQIYFAKKQIGLYSIAIIMHLGVIVCSCSYMPWSDYWNSRDIYQAFSTLRSKAHAGDAAAQYEYAYYFDPEQGEIEERLKWAKKSADQKYIPGLNLYAWERATHVSNYFRKGEEALKYATECCNLDEWKTAAYIDTLAAAYAELNDWENAVKYQKQAIEKADEDEKESFEDVLELYLDKKHVYD